MIKHYLGVEFHAKSWYVVWMDKAGQIQGQRRPLNEEMPEYLDAMPKNTLAVLEATRSWQHKCDMLSKDGASIANGGRRVPHEVCSGRANPNRRGHFPALTGTDRR